MTHIWLLVRPPDLRRFVSYRSKYFEFDIDLISLQLSKEDDVSRISTSIYVSNFPESFSTKDLFHSCKQYGHVVDTFIPFKRSKNEKRFGFVRFINVLMLRDLVKEFASLPNLKIVLKNESFAEIKIQYMGEFWVLLEFPSSKTKELFQENMEVGSWFPVLKQASSDFIPEGRIAFLIRAKEVPGWVPEFIDDSDDDDDDESDNGFKDGDAKVQDGGSYGDDSDEDPFVIYLLLNKNKDKFENMKPSDHILKYPLGFTPNGDNNEFCIHEENVRNVNEANSLNC
nr:nucleotide-binding alpha-beta plait domain-containing protein [Tanacetum cinerariifolium]